MKQIDLSNTTGTTIEVKFFDKYQMTDRERYLWLMVRIQRPAFTKMPHAYRSAAIAAASESLIRWKASVTPDEELFESLSVIRRNMLDAKRIPHIYAMKAMSRQNKRLKVKYGRRG